MAPAGRVVNGASIPEVVWEEVGPPYVGDYRRASVVHDVACDDKTEPHQQVHLMFYNAMRCDGVGFFQATLMYQAVKHFGPKWPTPLGVAAAAPPPEPPEVSFEQLRQAVRAATDELPADIDPHALDRRIDELLRNPD